MIGIIGAICGDIIGSHHEIFNRKDPIPYDFELIGENSSITDDTVHTIAVADWLMNTDRSSEELVKKLKQWTRDFYSFGYGFLFRRWAFGGSTEPYNSFGNGSAMRVSPVAWVSNSIDEVISLAERSAKVTHNHPEGVKGAVAVAIAIYLNRFGDSKDSIRQKIIDLTGYDLSRKYEDINYNNKFDTTCQGSVPEAIICWLDSTDYEDCIRKAVCLGSDTDTQAAIAGSICAANPLTQVPDYIVKKILDNNCLKDNRIVTILNKFNERFII